MALGEKHPSSSQEMAVYIPVKSFLCSNSDLDILVWASILSNPEVPRRADNFWHRSVEFKAALVDSKVHLPAGQTIPEFRRESEQFLGAFQCINPFL